MGCIGQNAALYNKDCIADNATGAGDGRVAESG